MSSEQIHDSFFCLLRLGLWEAATEPVDSFFPLSAQQWEKVFQLAVKQTVEGVLFEGVNKLPVALHPPKTLLLRWTVRVDAIERRNNWMNKIIAAQVRFFKTQNIHPILLKGQGLARCYPNPNVRVCGDIDWYVESKKNSKALFSMFQKQGLKPEAQAGFSFSFLWNNCDTEIHQRLLDLHNPFVKSFLKRLEKKEQLNRITLQVGEESVFLPSALLTYVQVNAHILKHLLSFGIGIRQLCDSARICFQYAHVIDGEELRQVYRKLGILKWIDLLHMLLVKYIGLEATSLPFPLPKNGQADWMMKEILVAGNFGFHDDRVDLAREDQTNQRVDSFKRWKNNFRRYIAYAPQETIFFPLVQFYSRFVK
ncbi:nucleotidyltransferase family protein [Sphingobacterium paludis]|uniref:Putative nucleotidyltransferase-like protein n=1 Tax=Sphingobacterium paludis TaxID=1476465 RepID=A0A4R7CZI8_9SPHI|nr:nucleotidyltransferase family protein [Sphingobacterium paludis]TDS13800.1 putative nucleotidyltransferase-like protein [Sphingobacterium paludis]